MQRLGGLLLIMAGVSLGAYTFLPAPFDTERSLREVTRISAAPDRPADAGRAAWLSSEPENETRIARTLPASGAPVETGAIAKAPDAAQPAPSRPAATWSAIVTADPSQQARITSSKPGDGETRAQLARDLQSELKRVGCYGGEVNGAWTSSTKRAMSTFMERVNATLPIEEPDYILLTLVQGHAEKACGAGCPAGQTASDDGRCVPQGVMAARTAKKAKPVQEAAAEPRERARRNADAGRITTAAAAPTLPAEPVRPAKPAARREAAEARVAVQNSETREQLPWRDDLSSPAPAPRTVRRPDGMMAIGASNVAAVEADMPAPAPVTSNTGSRKTVSIEPLMQDAPRAKAAPVLSSVQRGMPGTKAGPAIPRNKAAKPAKKKNHIVRRPAPQVAGKPSKPKFLYYAGSGRRGTPRPGSPAFNMLQAMGGVY